MKRMIILSLALAFVFSGFSNAFAKVERDTISIDVEFPEPKITLSTALPGYDRVEIEGMPSMGEVGEPVLPIKGLNVLIPPRKEVKDIDIILGDKVTLPGSYLIEPGQKEYPISQIGKIKIQPDKPKSEIYDSATSYPAKLHKLVSLQKKLGYSIAAIELCPVEYNPKKGEISYYRKITVLVRLESKTTAESGQGPKFTPKLRTKDKIKEKDKEEILRLINNKEDIMLYDQESLTSDSVAQESLSLPVAVYQPIGPIPSGYYDYVIITHPDFVSAFEPLKQRRIQKGFSAVIIPVDAIYTYYPGTRPDGGVDNQTKIRNFITDAYNVWGTRYVLLAGDGDGANVGGESGNNIIPARGLSDNDDKNIPADLYYACLDGTFDYDRDGTYGEKNDGLNGGEIDLLAEVCVGRAPVDSVTEANNFVKKTLAYEDSTDGYLTKNYMIGEYLGFGGASQYATDSLEEIRYGTNAHGYTTSGFLTNINSALDMNILYDALGWSWPKTDLINIMNNGVHILNHLGHANVSYDMKLSNSDADSLTNNKYFIVYSQGCYPGAFDNRTTSSTTYSASDCIAEHLTTNSTGAAAFVGNSRYGWGVTNSTNGSSQFYNRQFWDALFAEGITELGKMNQDSKEDNISYLNYGMNRWCYFELNLFGDPALKVHRPVNLAVDLDSYNFLEYYGNNDGAFDAGETLKLTTKFRAYNKDAYNVYATLSSQDPYVTIIRNNASFGMILKGVTTDNSSSPFIFKISSSCPMWYTIKFKLAISANGYNTERTLLIRTADKTPPTVTVSDSGAYSSSTTALTFKFSSSDQGSGVSEVWHRLTQDSPVVPPGKVISDWTPMWFVKESTITFNGSFQHNKIYYLSVKAKDNAGLWSNIASTDGIRIDTTPATTPVVIDQGSSTNSASTLSASWSASDLESNITEYQYRITRDSISGTVIRDWTSTGTASLVTATGLSLQNGKTYYFAVKAKNGAELWSSVGYSDGITKANNTPQVGTLSPASGSSYANQAVAFTTTFTDNDGWQDIAQAHLLVNTAISGANCFWGYYDQNTNRLYLYNDAGTAMLGGYAPGSGYTIENSYVKLNCLSTTVSGSGSTLTVRWNVTFKSTFRGTKNIYRAANDDSNAASSILQAGPWTIW